jgi:quercetin dioxygenase-like cupin family protein
MVKGNSHQPGPVRIGLPVVFLEFDLQAQIELLRREDAYQHGHNSKTLAKYADFRVVLTVISAGNRIQTHTAAGRISVQTVAGHIRMHVGDRLLDLPSGRLLVVDRTVPHDVEAIEESAFLLSVAWPEHVEH